MQSTTKPGTVIDHNQVRAAVNQLLEAAKPTEERRASDRQPFFWPVSIATNAGGERTVSAYTRDISPLGIGLLHTMPLERGEVIVTFSGHAAEPVSFRTDIQWCEASGEGWYLSGGRFLACVSTTFKRT